MGKGKNEDNLPKLRFILRERSMAWAAVKFEREEKKLEIEKPGSPLSLLKSDRFGRSAKNSVPNHLE